MYVELVWDIHFPGKFTREVKPNRQKKMLLGFRQNAPNSKNYFHKEEENRL